MVLMIMLIYDNIIDIDENKVTVEFWAQRSITETTPVTNQGQLPGAEPMIGFLNEIYRGMNI